MSDNSIDRLFSDNNEEEQPPEPRQSLEAETGQAAPTADSSGEDIYLHDIRDELASNEAKPATPKKQGFFSRVFGKKDKPQKPQPAAAEESGLDLNANADRTAPLYDGSPDEYVAANKSWEPQQRPASDAFEVYQGYEEDSSYSAYTADEEPHLGGGTETGATPLLSLDELEISGSPEPDSTFEAPEAAQEGQAEVSPPTPPLEGEEPSPEWKSFLSRFWKPKDEDEEAMRYRMADAQVESRLQDGAQEEGPEQAWLRKQREKKEKPPVFKTLEGETPQIDADWLAEFRAEAAPTGTSPSSEQPELNVNIEEDWLDEMRKAGETAEQPQPPAVAPSEDDWMAELRSQNADRESGNAMPLAPEGDWFEEARLQEQPAAEVRPQTNLIDETALENRLESTIMGGPEIEDRPESKTQSAPETPEPAKTSPLDNLFDERLFFDEPPDPLRRTAEPFDEPLPMDEIEFQAPSQTSGSDAASAAPVISNRLDELTEELGPDGKPAPESPAPPSGPSYSERYATIFAEAEGETTPEKVTEIRSEVLEGYEVPETPAEALQAAEPETRGQKLWDWFLSRTLVAQVLMLLVVVVLVFGAVLMPIYLVRTGAFAAKAEPTVIPTLALPKNQPYPTGVRLTGGWYFVVQPGSIKSGGIWAPSSGEWLIGTELRRVIGLPWSRQTEAVFQSLQPGDEIEVQLNNGDTAVYTIKTVEQVSEGDVSIFSGQTQSLVVVLFEQDARSRWAAIAEIKQ